MSFLILLCVGSILAWGAGRILGVRLPLRDAMRYGMGLAFCFTGVDHLLNAAVRYVPMMPDLLADHAFALVYFTGAAELAGGVALLLPQVTCPGFFDPR